MDCTARQPQQTRALEIWNLVYFLIEELEEKATALNIPEDIAGAFVLDQLLKGLQERQRAAQGVKQREVNPWRT